MMRFLRSYIPSLLMLIGGILIHQQCPMFLHGFLWVAALVVFVIHRKIGMMCFLLLSMFEFGIFLRDHHEKTFERRQKIVEKYTDQKHWIEGVVVSHPVPSHQIFSYLLETRQIQVGQVWENIRVRIKVNSKTYQFPEKGDVVRILAKPYVITENNLSQKIKNIQAYATVFQDKGWESIHVKHAWATSVRNTVFDSAKKFLTPQSYSYFRVMVFGDQALLNSAIMQRLKETGLLHLFVVSGFHIAFVWALGFWILRGTMGWYPTFHRKKNFFLWIEFGAILFVMFFLMLINPPVSTFRAVGSMILFLVLQATHRNQHSLWNLGIVFFIILLLNPLYLFDISTQLTFASVAGILLFSELLRNWLIKKGDTFHKITKHLLSVIAVTLGATVFTTPILYAHFGMIYPVSILYNLLIVPTLGSLISFLSVVAVLWAVIPIAGLQQVGFYVLNMLFEWFEKVLFWEPRLPLYTVDWTFTRASMQMGALALILFGILLSIYFYRKRKEIIF